MMALVVSHKLSEMLGFILLISGLLPFQVHRTKIYEAPIDEAYILRAEASYVHPTPNVCCVDWSVSAILVEDETLWAGLQINPEGAPRSGGLLRHDLKASSTQVYRIEDLIGTIRRFGDALLIGTSNGAYVLKEGRLTRHRAEPTIDGKFVLYTENL